MDLFHCDNSIAFLKAPDAAINWIPEKYDAANNCNYEDARDLIIKVQELNCKKADLIFEIGCGSGNITNMLCQNIYHQKIIACDVSPEMIDFASRTYNQSKTIKYLVQDFGQKWNTLDEEIQKLEGIVDMVFSNYVIHYIRDKESCVNNIFRLLKSGGICCLNIPHIPLHSESEFEMEFPTSENKYVNWLPKEEQFKQYERLLSESGFKILETSVDSLKCTFSNFEEFAKMFGPVAKACANTVVDINAPAEIRNRLLIKCEHLVLAHITQNRANDFSKGSLEGSVDAYCNRKRIICCKK